jgi:raffinose/stachyose/melibiose transport system permease protein
MKSRSPFKRTRIGRAGRPTGPGRLVGELLAVAATLILFGIPFLFVVFQAGKTMREAAAMAMAPPAVPQYGENLVAVLKTANGMVLRAFVNSTLITGFSIAVLVLTAAMTGFVLERRNGRGSRIAHFLIMAGLMIPPSVVTTIWVLQRLVLYRTMVGMVLIEVALAFPFSALMYRAFMVSIPREIDEASIIDGCGGTELFFRIIFPLLKPATSTVAILSAVTIFNDFVNPLYFFPGAKNATVQLTLYNFMTQFATQWNLLFANVLVISIPPLLFFIVFNRKIVEGMVAGAVKS